MVKNLHFMSSPLLEDGSVALQLLKESAVEQVVLMDVDPWIASFWKAVFKHTDWLVERIETADVTLENWSKYKHSKPRTILDQAWTGFYLNRTSFSGILEAKAGPLGGINQTSENKIDCRFPRATLVERIRRIAEYKEKVCAVWCISWEKGIARIREWQQQSRLPKDDLFFYVDPPFFEKADSLYRYYFQKKDHIRLRDFLLQLEDRWLLSYDSADQVFALYGDAIQQKTNGTWHDHVELLYSVSVSPERAKVKEIVLTNLEKLPEKQA